MGKFYIEKQTAHAIGEDLPGGGFLVHAGSTVMAPGTPLEKREGDLSKELKRFGILVEHGDDRLRFSKDHVFSSRAEAAGVIIDGNANGSNQWRYPHTGKTITASK
ncbi:DUF4357 domain-containing protein [Sulfitobacter sp. W002]|uniref:DUF4357 domain-containing protein n=1 Tax=Sulfitobacter sp. W002 TaxID=2867024 RepID=UPI0021A3D84A|nr:DUF4357 domain-containing protein [Sulfitobacter sp. W002]UWR30984.1 DUF4357 domain-containing protein [Sulfitobacter sp. W002]